MIFDELEKTLNINKERLINPGVPYLENSADGEADFMCFKFEIVKYGNDGNGNRARYTLATIDVTSYMEESLYKSEVTWNVDVMQELLRRMANMGYVGIAIDQDVIDKFLDYDSVVEENYYIDEDDGLVHFNTEESDILNSLFPN